LKQYGIDIKNYSSDCDESDGLFLYRRGSGVVDKSRLKNLNAGTDAKKNDKPSHWMPAFAGMTGFFKLTQWKNLLSAFIRIIRYFQYIRVPMPIKW
jgi:hypothetical protein